MAKKKTKVSMDEVMKYGFWVFAVIILLGSFGITFMAVGSISNSFTSRKDELENLKNAVEQIKMDSEHPNDETIDSVEAQTVVLKGKVYKAWETMHRDQKTKNTWPVDLGPDFLSMIQQKKPGESIPYNYRETYHNFITYHLPTMLEDVEWRHLEIQAPVNYEKWQERKQEYEEWQQRTEAGEIVPRKEKFEEPVLDEGGEMLIEKHPTTQKEVIWVWKDAIQDFSVFEGQRELSGGGGMGGSGGYEEYDSDEEGGEGMSSGMGGGGLGAGLGGGMGGSEYEDSEGGMGSGMGQAGTLPENQRIVGKVDWPNPEIFSLVTWEARPSSGEIWYAQEDLWVYEALLSVIQQSNATATGRHNAAVKAIDQMLIGKYAAEQLVSAESYIGNLTGEATSGMMGDGSYMDSAGSMGDDEYSSDGYGTASVAGALSTSGMNPDQAKIAQIRHGRYIDAEGEPLAHDDPPPFSEFNRMPIVLRLLVDQRKIPEILVNCANSSMPIDVLRVRFNPLAAQKMDLSEYLPDSQMGGMEGEYAEGGYEDEFGSGYESDSDSGMEGGEGANMAVGGATGEYGSEARLIEIHGVINIFNSPDPTLLATGSDAQQSGVTSGVTDEDLALSEDGEEDGQTDPTSDDTTAPADEETETDSATEPADAPDTETTSPDAANTTTTTPTP